MPCLYGAWRVLDAAVKVESIGDALATGGQEWGGGVRVRRGLRFEEELECLMALVWIVAGGILGFRVVDGLMIRW